MSINFSDTRPAGYAYLVDKLKLNTMPHWHASYVSTANVRRATMQEEQIKSIYPCTYWPGEGMGDHLEFAIKYDGIHLSALALIFNATPKSEIITYIQSRPTGKYARRIWFLYEFLTETRLPLENLTKGNYIDLLESDQYYTITPGTRIQRQRVINNLPGNKAFCPLVRRTEKLKEMETADLKKRCGNIISTYPKGLLNRALNYLYNKETKSSFEIENITPDISRIERFISLLTHAEHQDFCEKTKLIELQNKIVDPRFKDTDYRTNQNYVGQTVSYQNQLIHYVCPRPQDLPGLMEGLIACHILMKAGGISPIVHAAIIAYGFVFFHSFEDGNGRIHRFLIHNILSLQGMVPRGLMFPVSAVMLKDPAAYDQSLECFSNALKPLVQYHLDEIGQMRVLNDTGNWYRYMDMTSQAEALYDFVLKTIDKELIEQLSFLVNYDKTKKAIQEIIDMPDRLIDLFIQFCLQNNGQLSARKQAAYFDFLNDKEISLMEQAFEEGYKTS